MGEPRRSPNVLDGLAGPVGEGTHGYLLFPSLCALFFLTLFTAGFFRLSYSMPITGTAGLLLLLAAPLINPLAVWSVGPRGPTIAWLGLLGLAPLLCLGAHMALYDHRGTRSTPQDFGEVMLLGYCLCGFLLGSLAVVWFVSLLWCGPRPWFRSLLDRLLPRAALAAMGLASMVCLVSAGSAARTEDADAEAEVPRMRLVADVSAPKAEDWHGTGTDDAQEAVTEVSGLWVQQIREGSPPHCLLALAQTRGELPTKRTWNHRQAMTDEPCGALRVYQNISATLWILDTADARGRSGPPGTMESRPWPLAAFSRRDLRQVALAPAQMTGASPPAGWIVCAGLGLLCCLLGLPALRRTRRQLSWLAAAHEGTLGEDGRIDFADATPPCRLPVGWRIPPGPVTVVAGPPRPPTYREAEEIAPVGMAFGTLAEVRRRGQDRLCGQAAFMLAANGLTLGPVAIGLLVLHSRL